MKALFPVKRRFRRFMARKLFLIWILPVLMLTMVGCSGLRFSQMSPDAKDFHPKRVAVFPIEVWNHKDMIDSRGVVEQIVAGSLVEKKYFTYVLDAENLNQQANASEELSKVMKEYLSKLRLLNFPDPDLSRKIGDLTKTDAFLLASVDEWEFFVEKDQKMAKVGMTMELYDVATGKLMWKAGHTIREEYTFIKPELSKIARDVVHKMINYMPH
jgi:hypothetical protein